MADAGLHPAARHFAGAATLATVPRHAVGATTGAHHGQQRRQRSTRRWYRRSSCGAEPRRWGCCRCSTMPALPTLGLLQVLNNASIADDATLQKSMAFCDKHGVTKVSDRRGRVQPGRRLCSPSQPEDRPGSEAAQNAANPEIWSRHPFERREQRGRRAAPQTAAPRRAAPRRAAPRRAPHDGQRRRLEVRSYGARPQWP